MEEILLFVAFGGGRGPWKEAINFQIVLRYRVGISYVRLFFFNMWFKIPPPTIMIRAIMTTRLAASWGI